MPKKDNSFNKSGNTVLHQVALSDCQRKTIWEYLELINHQTIPPNLWRNTPLHTLIVNEFHGLAIAIIKKKFKEINFSLQDSQGKTILVLATKMRNSKLISVILQYTNKEIVNLKDSEALTALDYALALGDPTSVILLRKAGGIIQSNKKLTPSNILNSVSITPNRARNASFNNTRCLNGSSICYLEENNENKIVKVPSIFSEENYNMLSSKLFNLPVFDPEKFTKEAFLQKNSYCWNQKKDQF